MENSSNELKQLPEPQERKFVKRLGLQNCRNWLLNKCGPNLYSIRFGLVTSILVGSGLWYLFSFREKAVNLTKQALVFKFLSRESINVNYEFVQRFNGEKNKCYTLFYRMPLKEFDMLYRFRRVEITGNFDHDKEVLIESCKNGERGYNVYTPFYYYLNTSMDTNGRMVGSDGNPVAEQRITPGGIVVHRGWIPAHLKDRRTRPCDVNKHFSETIHGGLRYHEISKLHDFRTPNDPSLDYWNNLSLTDLSEYWDLPNKFETNLCYVQEVDLKDTGLVKYEDVFPVRTDIHSFLKENGNEMGLKTFPYYGPLKKTVGGLTLFNVALGGLLL